MTIGRPRKYNAVLLQLADNELYSPAGIAKFALEHQCIEGITQEAEQLAYTRIRIAMGRLAKWYKFPAGGDGFVILKGQAATAAWFGWRWRSTIKRRWQPAL